MGGEIIHFLHVSEHIDHFKDINVFSSGKNPKIYWSGGAKPPPLPPPSIGKRPIYIYFFRARAPPEIACVKKIDGKKF